MEKKEKKKEKKTKKKKKKKKRAQTMCSWKLIQVAVLKYRVYTRLKTRLSMADIFNLLRLVGKMLQPVLATHTNSGINIRFRNKDVMTSTQMMKLQHMH
jgi:hypothetical protein